MQQSSDTQHIGHFNVISMLGEGTYGVVLKCKDTISGQYVAIKRFREEKRMSSSHRKSANREYHFLTTLRHPNIIHQLTAFTINKLPHLVLELLDCSLLDVIQKHEQGVCACVVRNWGRQLLLGLDYLHHKDVAHRDIKPENVLIGNSPLHTGLSQNSFDPDYYSNKQFPCNPSPHNPGCLGDEVGTHVKICDLGFARSIPRNALGEVIARKDEVKDVDPASDHHRANGGRDGPSKDMRPLTQYVSTRWYRSPELLLGHDYTHSIDVWALGCVLSELATGIPLFPGTDDENQWVEIQQRMGVSLRGFHVVPKCKKASPGYQPLSYCTCGRGKDSIMSINPRHTAVWQGLINKLGPSGADVVSQMLCLNPKCRLTTSEALQHPFFRNTTSQSNSTSNISMPCQHQQNQQQQNQQEKTQQQQQQNNNNNNNSKYGQTREPEMNPTTSAHSQISNTSQTPSTAVAVAATGGNALNTNNNNQNNNNTQNNNNNTQNNNNNNNGQDTPQPPNVPLPPAPDRPVPGDGQSVDQSVATSNQLSYAPTLLTYNNNIVIPPANVHYPTAQNKQQQHSANNNNNINPNSTVNLNYNNTLPQHGNPALSNTSQSSSGLINQFTGMQLHTNGGLHGQHSGGATSPDQQQQQTPNQNIQINNNKQVAVQSPTADCLFQPSSSQQHQQQQNLSQPQLQQNKSQLYQQHQNNNNNSNFNNNNTNNQHLFDPRRPSHEAESMFDAMSIMSGDTVFGAMSMMSLAQGGGQANGGAMPPIPGLAFNQSLNNNNNQQQSSNNNNNNSNQNNLFSQHQSASSMLSPGNNIQQNSQQQQQQFMSSRGQGMGGNQSLIMATHNYSSLSGRSNGVVLPQGGNATHHGGHHPLPQYHTLPRNLGNNITNNNNNNQTSNNNNNDDPTNNTDLIIYPRGSNGLQTTTSINTHLANSATQGGGVIGGSGLFIGGGNTTPLPGGGNALGLHSTPLTPQISRNNNAVQPPLIAGQFQLNSHVSSNNNNNGENGNLFSGTNAQQQQTSSSTIAQKKAKMNLSQHYSLPRNAGPYIHQQLTQQQTGNNNMIAPGVLNSPQSVRSILQPSQQQLASQQQQQQMHPFHHPQPLHMNATPSKSGQYTGLGANSPHMVGGTPTNHVQQQPNIMTSTHLMNNNTSSSNNNTPQHSNNININQQQNGQQPNIVNMTPHQQHLQSLPNNSLKPTTKKKFELKTINLSKLKYKAFDQNQGDGEELYSGYDESNISDDDRR